MKTKQLTYNLVRENLVPVIFVVSLLTLSSLIETISVISIAPIVDLIINPDISTASDITLQVAKFFNRFNLPVSFISVGVFYLAIVIIKNVIKTIFRFASTKLLYRLVKKVIYDEFKSFLSASWQFFVSKKYGVIGNTIVNETRNVGFSYEAVVEILANALGILFYIVAAFLISWKLTTIVLVLVAITLAPFATLGKITYKIGSRFTALSNDFHALILESFNAAKLIIGFGNQEASFTKLTKIIPGYVRSASQFIMIRVITPLAFEPFGIVIVILAAYLGVYEFKLSVSETFIIIYVFRTCNQYALNITNAKNTIQNIGPSLEQIYNLKEEAERMVQPSGNEVFASLKDEIRLIDVSFSYPDHKNVLNHINIMIPKGKMVAIVGKSGSGKTTLTDIIMGFYQIESGQYLLDRIPFEQIDVNSWRKKIGYVPQDAFLFNMSLRDNFLWSNENAADAEIYQACEIANANEFIERLPKRLDTIVSERGIRFSGGERQRIALARAILRKPEVLILDEATSSLDSHSELLIQQSIDNIAKFTTIIVVAHRLSTVKKSDYIYVLDEGFIVEEGSFETLSSMKDGEFWKAAKLQGMVVY